MDLLVVCFTSKRPPSVIWRLYYLESHIESHIWKVPTDLSDHKGLALLYGASVVTTSVVSTISKGLRSYKLMNLEMVGHLDVAHCRLIGLSLVVSFENR